MNSSPIRLMTATWFRHKLEARLACLIQPDGVADAEFLQLHGEPALLASDPVSWKIFKSPLGLYIGGVTAVILQLLSMG